MTSSMVQDHSVSVMNADLTSEQRILADHGAQTIYSTYQKNAGTKGERDYGDILSSDEDAERRA